MGERRFVLWKLTYIALCKSSLFWLRFSPFWANFFKDLLIWLIIVWQVCILGWVSDKYSYLLKPCCNYIFQVSILSISTKVMGGNDNLWISLKSHYILFKDRKIFQVSAHAHSKHILFFRLFLGYLNLKLF